MNNMQTLFLIICSCGRALSAASRGEEGTLRLKCLCGFEKVVAWKVKSTKLPESKEQMKMAL
jgi:hypothetical protein